MSEATKIYDKGLSDGKRIGVRDMVAQDRERLAFASALLLAELLSIARGDDHDCRPESMGAALASGMPRADGRCCECAIVTTLEESGVRKYQQVLENLRGINGDDKST